MIRSKNKKQMQQENQVLSLDAGKSRILRYLSEYVYDRLNMLITDDTGALRRSSLPGGLFIAMYDTAFTMCIQEDPNNHSQAVYDWNIELLEMYIAANCRVPVRGIHSAESYLKKWLQSHWRAELVIRCHHRIFSFLDRIQNSDRIHAQNFLVIPEGVKGTATTGWESFATHVLKPCFPAVLDAVLQLTRDCRADTSQALCDERKWTIMRCIHSMRWLNEVFEEEPWMYSMDKTRLALLVTGYVRRSTAREIPSDLLLVLIAFRGRASENVFDQFMRAFIADSVRYYTIKAQRWRYSSNLSIDAYVLKCRSVLKFEESRLELWGLRANERFEFRGAIESVLFDATLMDISELDWETSDWMRRLVGRDIQETKAVAISHDMRSQRQKRDLVHLSIQELANAICSVVTHSEIEKGRASRLKIASRLILAKEWSSIFDNLRALRRWPTYYRAEQEALIMLRRQNDSFEFRHLESEILQSDSVDGKTDRCEEDDDVALKRKKARELKEKDELFWQ